MRLLKWIGLFAAVLLVVACFMPWITIPTRGITISGVYTEGTRFGKPAYFHIILVVLFVVFVLAGKLWSVRANLAVGALNLAWAIRNFLMISMCRGGECPEKEPAIYLVLASSVIMMLTALFPDVKVRPQKP